MSWFKRNMQPILSAAGLALMYAQGGVAQDATRQAPESASVPAEPAATTVGIEAIVVTARRRQESAQDTPVSVSVLSAADLQHSGVEEIRDVMESVPGVNLAGQGSSFNTVFSIRGMSRGVIGNAQPSVATYVNEVPVSTQGASVPTYDMASVQVLKGPQGTLFGRNTTAGALVIATQVPTEELGGYASAIFGSYDWRQYEGAFNLPLLDNKVLLRVAGQLLDRDGYTRNQSQPGRDLDDRNRDNFRISLQLQPFEGFKNLTVYERNAIDEVGAGMVFYRFLGSGDANAPTSAVDLTPWFNGTLLSPLGSCGATCRDQSCGLGRLDGGGREGWSVSPLFWSKPTRASG
jgi:iron complex outermembrane receptor protein